MTQEIDQAARLRKIGWIVLLAGLVVGGLIYLIWPEEISTEENTLANQYYKNQELETQRLWGNSGSLILGLTRSLRRASTYSVLIIVLSALVSIICFYLASHPHDGNKEQK